MNTFSEIPMGSVVLETVENYEAIVLGHQILVNGCRRAVLQERRLKDGAPVKRESCDIQSLLLLSKAVQHIIDEDEYRGMLGLSAKDLATGYLGKITIVDQEISGAISFSLQSQARTSAGDRVEPSWVSEQMLELLETKKETYAPKPTGSSNQPSRQETPR